MNITQVHAPAEQGKTTSHTALTFTQTSQPLTALDWPSDTCVHRLFEARVKERPSEIAVIALGKTLTYQQLNQQANQLAHHLKTLGVGPDVLVGVCLDRSPEMIVALLAILKAGGAYVPLDPDYPAERLSFILQDTQVRWVVTRRDFCSRLPTATLQPICLDQDWITLAQQPSDNPETPVQPQNLMYVIYTSGSTGKPKGVMIPHGGILNQLIWRQTSFPLSSTDRVLQNISFSFDPSVWQIFWPLSCGAQLVLPHPGGHKEIADLVDLMAQTQVTVIALVPSMLSVLLRQPNLDRLNHLKHVFCGGEALPQTLLAEFFQRFQAGPHLHNVYGPTEASIDAACWTCQSNWADETVPIGYPILNAQLYVLDDRQQRVKPGEVGELYIGGKGLAKGYLNRPDLTADRFITNPFLPSPTDRLYRTGDLVRTLPGGEFVFVGRVDQQVKVRGFRIELGEIEQVLQLSPDVANCAVAVQVDASNRKRIVAYVVWTDPDRADPTRLRSYLASRLPDYMVPTLWVPLSHLPLNPNGKLDRRALPVPDFLITTDKTAKPVSMDAGSSKAENLSYLWKALLGCDQVNLNDSFFDLGGDSLMVMQLALKIEETFNQRIPVSYLLQNPTLSGMLKALAAQQQGQSFYQPLEIIQAEGNALPLFCFHDRSGTLNIYHQLSRLMGNKRPIYGLQADGLEPYASSPVDRVEALAQTYVHEILKIQPKGPLHLCGYSFGGLIAYEVACQLTAMGYEVATLSLLDVMNVTRRWFYRASRWDSFLEQGNLYKVVIPLQASLWGIRVKLNELALKLRTSTASSGAASQVTQWQQAISMQRTKWARACFDCAQLAYRPKAFQGATLLIKAEHQENNHSMKRMETMDETMGWGALVNDALMVQGVPCGHFDLKDNLGLELVAPILKSHLDRAEAEVG